MWLSQAYELLHSAFFALTKAGMLQRQGSPLSPKAGALVPLADASRPSSRQECDAPGKPQRELSRHRKGWGCTALEFQQRTNTPSACTRNDSFLSQTRLNHWKYQNNDEVTFPKQGTGARYSHMEKHVKKGVQAGASSRQAPQASVSFKNSLRLPGDFFFLCREQRTGQHYRGFKTLYLAH